MLRSMRSLKGYKLGAIDGDIGKVRDFYFDDKEWVVRYLVADTGTWLPGRLVLISPLALGRPDWATGILPVDLTTEQVEESPSIDVDKPVSRQQEEQLARHFGWPIYWSPSLMYAGAGVPTVPEVVASPWEAPRDTHESDVHDGDARLQSARTLMGYHVQANDGQIGHVEDFILDDEKWVIRYMVVDTKNWWPSRKVLTLPMYVIGIHWQESVVRVNAPRETVASGPTFEPSAPINRDYEVRLYDYYGRPK